VQLPSAWNTADAAFTSELNIACAVMTADCVPILLTDDSGSTVCAIHAGWKGLELNIIGKTVAKAFPKSDSVVAWIGPSISSLHYEVNLELGMRFSAYSGVVSESKNDNRVMLNLSEIASQQLEKSGVSQVFSSGMCTYAEENRFFSYRRSTHQGFRNCGRTATVIVKLK
jgi:YfiH family protein